MLFRSMPTPCFLVRFGYAAESCPSVAYTPVIKINNFQGELTDISAKKEALATSAFVLADIYNDSVTTKKLSFVTESSIFWIKYGTSDIPRIVSFRCTIVYVMFTSECKSSLISNSLDCASQLLYENDVAASAVKVFFWIL